MGSVGSKSTDFSGLASGNALQTYLQEINHWLRLSIFLHKPIRVGLLFIFHNDGNDTSYDGLPKDPADLYRFFNSKKKIID